MVGTAKAKKCVRDSSAFCSAGSRIYSSWISTVGESKTVSVSFHVGRSHLCKSSYIDSIQRAESLEFGLGWLDEGCVVMMAEEVGLGIGCVAKNHQEFVQGYRKKSKATCGLYAGLTLT